MNRTDIADHLGLRIETVCRELAILRAVDAIALEGTQEILIRDPDALRARSGGDFDELLTGSAIQLVWAPV